MMNIIKISSFMDKYLVAKKRNFHRFGILPVDLVIDTMSEIQSLPQTNIKRPQIEAFGQLIDTLSVKLRTFVVHGTSCRCCGIKGAFFAVEVDKAKPDEPILNLYAINDSGHEVLMNADHRLPKAKGGSDGVDNMQTMCQPCNKAKGCKAIFTEGGVSKKELKEKSKMQQSERSKRLSNEEKHHGSK